LEIQDHEFRQLLAGKLANRGWGQLVLNYQIASTEAHARLPYDAPCLFGADRLHVGLCFADETFLQLAVL